MNNQKVYQELASRIVARQNCIKSNNTEWLEKHTDVIEAIIKEQLPHGSGLDGTWSIDFNKSNENRIVLSMGYHAMNENGFYDGWIDFQLVITPSLVSEIGMRITGNFGKYQDIKEYLYDTLYGALVAEIGNIYNFVS